MNGPDIDLVNKMIATAISPVEAHANGALGLLTGSSGKYLVPVGVDSNGRSVSLAVQDQGTAVLGTLVMIPGDGFDAEAYQFQTSFFVQEGFRVVIIDQRGQGDSSKPTASTNFGPPLFGPPPPNADYSLDVFADDLKAALDQIQPPIEGNVTLWGHSLGTAIACHYVAKYKAAHVTKLALTGMTPDFTPAIPVPTYDGTIANALALAGPIGAYPDVVAFDLANEIFFGGPAVSPGNTTPAILAQYQNIFLKTPLIVEGQLLQLVQFTLPQLDADFPLITIPTLFITGANDVVSLPAYSITANALIPGSVGPVVQIATAGHMVMYQQAAIFNADLIGFAV